ncbi:hypothetical protein SDC9_92510 [bioreactor metagenome]|uniref:Uncharacterized protein n=1 Tax=bioreactor metagenome TaxID=1076179 RepID=A0A644ZZE3_9ZZZZ
MLIPIFPHNGQVLRFCPVQVERVERVCLFTRAFQDFQIVGEHPVRRGSRLCARESARDTHIYVVPSQIGGEFVFEIIPRCVCREGNIARQTVLFFFSVLPEIGQDGGIG